MTAITDYIADGFNLDIIPDSLCQPRIQASIVTENDERVVFNAAPWFVLATREEAHIIWEDRYAGKLTESVAELAKHYDPLVAQFLARWEGHWFSCKVNEVDAEYWLIVHSRDDLSIEQQLKFHQLATGDVPIATMSLTELLDTALNGLDTYINDEDADLTPVNEAQDCIVEALARIRLQAVSAVMGSRKRRPITE